MSAKLNNRVLVAGASGVIGRTLCRMLVEDGYHVTGQRVLLTGRKHFILSAWNPRL